MALTGELGDAAAADRLECRRAAILERYAEELELAKSRIIATQEGRDSLLEQAANVHADVCQSLRAGVVCFDATTLPLTAKIGVGRAESGVHPSESLRAGDLLFDVLLDEVQLSVADSPRHTGALAAAAASLHHSIMTRIREGAMTYASFLLGRIHEAHVKERGRIVRELHDRVGSGISAAVRNLELFQSYVHDQPERAIEKVRVAESALRDAVDAVRQVVVDLRLHAQVETMEAALRRSVQLMSVGNTEVRLKVSGDETWAAPEVLDELFLVVREALRNAVAHARAATVAAQIDIAPHELHAAIQDDGIGFVTGQRTFGVGLSAMQERVSLLGGIMTITSAPDQGTSIEVAIPLIGAARGPAS